MDDIKYYQNELTNIESKSSGLKYALSLNNSSSEIDHTIINDFMNNERNNHFDLINRKATKRKNGLNVNKLYEKILDILAKQSNN